MNKERIGKVTGREIAAFKRNNTLKQKTGLALQALQPLVSELATYGQENIDFNSYNFELVDQIGQKNPFVVRGDINETSKKAINFLLQKYDLDWIAS